jgi:3-hydroxyacyl-[acyl-carrier-protein] dehydratase
MIQVEITIPPDHPSAAGHFPGNPIVPGALLLSEVIRAWETQIAAPLDNLTIKVAKFLSPTIPGDTLSIQFESVAQTQVKFQCTVKGTTVLSGAFEFSVVQPNR